MADAQLLETIEAAAVRPNVNVERDDTRRLAGDDCRHSIWPPAPPLVDLASVQRGIVHPVRSQWAFSGERIRIKLDREHRPATRGIFERSADGRLSRHRCGAIERDAGPTRPAVRDGDPRRDL